MGTLDDVAREIQIFTEVLERGGVSSSIPPIQTYKSSKFLAPRLAHVFGNSGIADIFTSEILRYTSDRSCSPINVLSLGSGACDIEFEIIVKMRDRGFTPRFTCTDLTPSVINYAKNKAKTMGIEECLEFSVINLNEYFPQGQYDAVIANHSLHHFVNLEYIFSHVKSAIGEEGCFVVSDMIGKNGHMRWPEVMPFLDAFWEYLPLEKRRHTASGMIHPTYINYDCTISDPYEGVRAQDILGILVSEFCFSRFVGFGNLADIFCDRIYGNNFSPENEEDLRFIDLVERVNDHLVDLGIIKPTSMIATLDNHSANCHYDRWSPQFCVRRV